MYYCYTFLLCVCMGAAVLLAAPKKLEKDCNMNKFDEHSANCFAQFGLDELKFPESTSELGTYCRKVRSSNEFSKQYGDNCLKSTSQTLMSLASYNFDVVNKPYCAKKGKKREDFVSWAPCGNAAKTKTKPCWERMITIMGNAMKVKESKMRLPLVCCTYYEWIKCTGDALNSMGSKVCKKSTVDAYIGHINKASVDSMNLICSKYDNDPKKCEPYMKEAIFTKLKKPHKTPLLYVFEIFDKL